MNRGTACFTITILLLALLITPGVLAAGDLDEDALELFLDKLASMSDEGRELGALILEKYILQGDEEIEQLKDVIETIITEEQKSQLEDYGYSVEDVKQELDRLKKWSLNDREKLVEYIREGNVSGVEDLILEYEDVKDRGESTGGGG